MTINAGIKSTGWYLMLFAAIGVSAYALSLGFLPAIRNGFVDNMLLTTPSAALLHFLGGGIVLLAGASQFHKGWRTRYPRLHRWLGRVYVGGVLIGGIAGLYLAFFASGGLAARFGFGLLAVLWLVSTALAFRYILKRDIKLHQRWMIRSYAMTLGAVTLRIWLPLFLMLGVPFDQAYPAIAWLAWVPNLIIAEWVFLRSRQ
ncbi:DUF2306 domain-containing protein [Pseudohongiella sp.]|nr:DUF2306 domain-containing protein [Pseudohongiella sp.]